MALKSARVLDKEATISDFVHNSLTPLPGPINLGLGVFPMRGGETGIISGDVSVPGWAEVGDESQVSVLIGWTDRSNSDGSTLSGSDLTGDGGSNLTTGSSPSSKYSPSE